MATTSTGGFGTLLARVGLDWFILALLGMIGLAKIWPEPGIQTGPFSLDALASYGVSLIFFFYGLKLNFGQLRAGLRNARLHALIQLTTFVLFPAIIWLTRPVLDTADAARWLGIYYVAALPSTVSSSVVMVSIAGGNLPAAIFNASISSLIGVFVTPVWMSLVMESTTGTYDLGGVIGKLAIQVIAPVVLGLLLNRKLGWLTDRYRSASRYFDQFIILLIVYTAFSESFAHDRFAGYSAGDLAELALFMLGLFLLVVGLLTFLSNALSLSRPDRITALFCGSKKSLVQGSVMAGVLFPASLAGPALLPIMMYHAIQLIAASIIAQSMARHQPPPQ